MSFAVLPRAIMSLFRMRPSEPAPAEKAAVVPGALPEVAYLTIETLSGPDYQFDSEGLFSDEVRGMLHENYAIRPLASDDFHKGYVETLSQLTTVGNLTEELFQERFARLKRFNEIYYCIAIEDLTSNKIVGLGTIMIEDKFIHEAGRVGHIEDIVVNDCARGKNLGKIIIEALKFIGKEKGAYKTLLACSQHNIGFYAKCGMAQKEVVMSVYY
ncbi:putative glucosamine-phosphate N-acetyltransferase [Polychytrium aggregatum]|uniref:putative glucosamine-phosphate N-acetyltransferase n=1 Tax=Polychytrium aggregatum TaxID=110093 RepID=UPI0022FE3EF3|nr:putative glucosamine-phosphate N-acetyltransferase [Polychytrium aggregatum]KAI9203544.1 putative glucosamine-phosphate N-acetyltransferase [Polychytrium aggregatum]